MSRRRNRYPAPAPAPRNEARVSRLPHKVFESLEELASVASMPHAFEANVNHRYYTDESIGKEGGGWVCADRPVHSFADIKRHLNAPLFPEGVARIEELAKGLQAPSPISRRRKPVRADAGDELDMGRVWDGDLEHAWRATRREQAFGPSRVLIAVNVVASYNTSPSEMALRGAAALALATSLKEAGYTVSIIGVTDITVGTQNGERLTAEAKLLNPDSELDIHKLASLIASGLLFRGVMMDYIVRVAPTRVDGGVGTPRTLSDDSFDRSGYDYVATVDDGELQSTRDAQAWLVKHMAALQPSQE
jgi:hypothetical protein